MSTVGNNLNGGSYNEEPSSSSSTSKYKTYLIEKLLNESSNSLNNRTAVSPPQHHGMMPEYADNDETDARSETGTYTIDDNGAVGGAAGGGGLPSVADIAVHADLDDADFDDNAYKNNHSAQNVESIIVAATMTTTAATAAAVVSSSTGFVVGKSTTAPSIAELASARAAIDQTFGVLATTSTDSTADNVLVGSESLGAIVSKQAASPSKRSTQKVTRLRNKTYSLKKDLIDGYKISIFQTYFYLTR